jgi:dCMP deaminase
MQEKSLGQDTITMSNDKWDWRFISLAYEIAQWSKDPSTQVGAVIVRPDKTIASVGYNGFPRGMSDDSQLYLDRDTKYSRVIHGEMNAILSAKEPLKGFTLYTVPCFTCDRCAVHVIQAGIARVVSAKSKDEGLNQRSADAWQRAAKYYDEAGVKYIII